MSAEAVTQGRTILLRLGFTEAQIAKMQQTAAVAVRAPRPSARPVVIRRRSRYNDLRRRIAQCPSVTFTPPEVGERSVSLLRDLLKTAELECVRPGQPGRPRIYPSADIRSRRFLPLYKRTDLFWQRYARLQALQASATEN